MTFTLRRRWPSAGRLVTCYFEEFVISGSLGGGGGGAPPKKKGIIRQLIQ